MRAIVLARPMRAVRAIKSSPALGVNALGLRSQPPVQQIGMVCAFVNRQTARSGAFAIPAQEVARSVADVDKRVQRNMERPPNRPVEEELFYLPVPGCARAPPTPRSPPPPATALHPASLLPTQPPSRQPS